jgi:hypothetical protein
VKKLLIEPKVLLSWSRILEVQSSQLLLSYLCDQLFFVNFLVYFDDRSRALEFFIFAIYLIFWFVYTISEEVGIALKRVSLSNHWAAFPKVTSVDEFGADLTIRNTKNLLTKLQASKRCPDATSTPQAAIRKATARLLQFPQSHITPHLAKVNKPPVKPLATLFAGNILRQEATNFVSTTSSETTSFDYTTLKPSATIKNIVIQYEVLLRPNSLILRLIAFWKSMTFR